MIGAILLSDDGTYPGIIFDVDINGWWRVCWLKWGADSPDRILSYIGPHDAVASQITAQECARRFYGYVPDLESLGLMQ